ncbi:unnamed protein product [Prorocentrum cordatum]|uniref:Uncharacterized protein n=1 Tax=Prorocentrum cordatum TaxID=2364126 RepID=A0ABN9V6H7_9DINO|nr:unnamed protein product [Polarella glacialis]
MTVLLPQHLVLAEHLARQRRGALAALFFSRAARPAAVSVQCCGAPRGRPPPERTLSERMGGEAGGCQGRLRRSPICPPRTALSEVCFFNPAGPPGPALCSMLPAVRFHFAARSSFSSPI